MKINNYKELKLELDKIDFSKNDNLIKYKEELYNIFDLNKFNLNSFNDFTKEIYNDLLNSDKLVSNNYYEVIEQIDKSLNIALNKNNDEINNVTSLIQKEIDDLEKDLINYKDQYREDIFKLKINNETLKSDNYAFFEEEITQIKNEEKDLKQKHLISLAKLENDQKNKIDKINNKYKDLTEKIKDDLNSLKKPYELKVRSLKEKLNNEIENKDNTYLTIKKTHNQSSFKFNEFIDNVRKEYNKEAKSIITKFENKQNDLKIDIEDLNDYFNSIINIIKDEHADKIKALDIVFDVQKAEHEKLVNKLIHQNNEEITSINAKYRELRNNINKKIESLEKEKNDLLLKNKDYNERQNINIKYNKIINPLKNEIFIINNKNEIELTERNNVFETELYNQDINHLKNVNEWRFTKELYDNERSLKLNIEKEKYEHELFILTEKEKLNQQIKDIQLKINQINMEKDLLPIESQLHFSSSLQSRDINLLNIEFDSFKLNNELELKLVNLNKELNELDLIHKLNIAKETLKFNQKIIEVTYQLYIQKEIIERDRDLDILTLQKKLQETLLKQKNQRQENILQGKINKANIKLELYENEITFKIRTLNRKLNLETQKRNFIILNIKNKIQQNKNNKFSNLNIDLSLNSVHLSEKLNNYLLEYLLLNSQYEQNLINIYFDMFNKSVHPKILRDIHKVINSFNNNILKNNFEAIHSFKTYEETIFKEKINNLFSSKYQFKHSEVINKYNSSKNAQKAILDDLNDKIEQLNKEQNELDLRIENNNLIINSIKYSSNKINKNEKEQISLLNDEIKSNQSLIRNNKKLMRNLSKQAKVYNKILTNFTLKQLKEEKRLKRAERKEKKYYYKLINMYNKEINKLKNLIDTNSIKYQTLISKINGSKYLDDKQMSNSNKAISKYFEELNQNLIDSSYNVLSVWKKLHSYIIVQENKVIKTFEDNVKKSINLNDKNFKKFKKLFNRENNFLTNLFNKEKDRLNKELINIQNNTNLNITETHNIYHIFYNETEANINELKNKALNDIKLVNDNLSGVIKQLKVDKEKSLNKIKDKFNKNKTSLLTDQILTNDEIKDLNIKTNQRYSIILNRYEQNRKNHLDNMKKRRSSFSSNINDFNKNSRVYEETYNILVNNNLDKLKNNIKLIKRDFNKDKRQLRKLYVREMRENRKKLKQSLKFKKRQIKKKYK